MAKYRCGLCRKIVDRPEKRADWFRETCSKHGREAIMRRVEPQARVAGKE